MSRPYQQEYGSFYGSQPQEQPAAEESLQVSNGEYPQQLLTHSFQAPHPYIPGQSQPPSQGYEQHGITPMLPSQGVSAEPSYGLDQPQIVPSQMQRQMSTVSSHYNAPYEGYPQQAPPSASRKRSHPDDEYAYDQYSSNMQQLHASAGHLPVEMNGPQGQMAHYPYQVQHDRSSPPHGPGASIYSMPAAQHHHHRLPNQPPPSKMQRFGVYETEPEDHGPPSVVGQPGMPEPAPRPKGPKLKFTSEDDGLLVELKETKNLTWKQIADFFPGRSSGTLQVRYCTKLKAKTTVWTDEMVQKLHAAIDEYETDKWRIISGKVGNGFSAGACKEKSAEMNGEVLPEEELENLSHDDAPVSATASVHDPRDSYQDTREGPYPESRDSYRLDSGYHRESEGCVVPVSGPMDGPAMAGNNFFRYDVPVA